MRVREILYLCDGKACESPGHCWHNKTGECRHTARLEHALHPDRNIAEFETWLDPVEAYRDQGMTILVEPTDA